MSLAYYKLSIIVTGVTGLLRVKSLPRNTVKALHHLTFNNTVTAVTGLRTCARVKKYFFIDLNLNYKFNNIFLTCEKITRNICNTRNNHCFYYNFIFFRRNNSGFTCNKLAFTRNNRLKNQQG